MKWKKLNLQLFADAHEQLQNTTGNCYLCHIMF